MISTGWGVLCGGDPLAGFSVGFVSQCPWEAFSNCLYCFVQRISKIGFIWTILMYQLHVKFRYAVISNELCSLTNWKWNCIFNIIIKNYIIFHCHTILNYLRYWRINSTGWTVRGSNPSEDEIFHTCPDCPCGPPSLLYNGYRGFPGGKALGRSVDHPPPSSAEVKERVGLYLYFPSGLSWPVLGWNLPFYWRMMGSKSRKACNHNSG